MDGLEQRVANLMHEKGTWACDPPCDEAAIARAIIPMVLEEAAKVATGSPVSWMPVQIAAAILQAKEPTDG